MRRDIQIPIPARRLPDCGDLHNSYQVFSFPFGNHFECPPVIYIAFAIAHTLAIQNREHKGL